MIWFLYIEKVSRWIQVCREVLIFAFSYLTLHREANNLTVSVCWFWALSPTIVSMWHQAPPPSPAVFLFASKKLWAASQQLLIFSHHCCCWCCFPFCMENPSGDLFDSCFFYYHLIEEVISTVAPGAVIIDTFIPFFLLFMLLLFITAFLFSPCLLVPLILTLPAIIGVFEVKGRLVPTSKYHFVLLCVFWDRGEYNHVCRPCS